MNLDKFLEWLKLNKNSKKTIKNYYQQISRFAKLYNNEINQTNIDNYIIKLKEENKSLSSINAFKIALYAYCEFSGDKFNIPTPKSVRRKDIKFYFTEEDLKEISKNSTLMFRDYDLKDLLLRFMFYTGARPSEILNLEVDHIDFKNKVITFYGAKGNKDRIIPFLDNKLFNDIKNHCNNKQGKVFDIKYGQINRMLKKIKSYLELNECEVVEPRTMRISFAKYCVSKGMNILVLKKLMGHNDIKITELYAEPDEKMIKEVCENIRKGE